MTLPIFVLRYAHLAKPLAAAASKVLFSPTVTVLSTAQTVTQAVKNDTAMVTQQSRRTGHQWPFYTSDERLK